MAGELAAAAATAGGQVQQDGQMWRSKGRASDHSDAVAFGGKRTRRRGGREDVVDERRPKVSAQEDAACACPLVIILVAAVPRDLPVF
jgi:hypothetical protein